MIAKGVLLALITFAGALMMYNCRLIMHKLKTGDYDNEKNTMVSAKQIHALRPGQTTAKEFRQIFKGETQHQMTFLEVRTREHQRRKYQFDKLISAFQYSKRTEENPLFTTHGFKERIYLTGFFKGDILQFYSVNHEGLGAKNQ